jgi:hypothetical protein
MPRSPPEPLPLAERARYIGTFPSWQGCVEEPADAGLVLGSRRAPPRQAKEIEMSHLLMPRASAVWLVENTPLTFEQIAEFCGLHTLEIQAIADGEVAVGMQGLDPVNAGQLTQEELNRCIADPSARLTMVVPDLPQPEVRHKGPRYTPIAKRQDKPDAIAWLLKSHPELSDGQISRLLGTTKNTITGIRDRTHWNSQNIRPRNPVALGLCTQADLDDAVSKSGATPVPREVRLMTAEEAKAVPGPRPAVVPTDAVDPLGDVPPRGA